MCAQFHVNWNVQRESARNCAYARIDTSGFICAQQLSRFWHSQSFSKKSTQVLVHEAPGVWKCAGLAHWSVLFMRAAAEPITMKYLWFQRQFWGLPTGGVSCQGSMLRAFELIVYFFLL